MGLRINNNIAAQNAYRNLSITDNQMSKSLEKLSSGFRINRAADDAAGLSISEGLRAQTGGLKVAVRNAQDGISVVQTAEGALTETHAILQRMRDLSVQAANGGSQDASAQGAANSEFGQLKTELDRISNTTSYGTQKLLNGSYGLTEVDTGTDVAYDPTNATPVALASAAGGTLSFDATVNGVAHTAANGNAISVTIGAATTPDTMVADINKQLRTALSAAGGTGNEVSVSETPSTNTGNINFTMRSSTALTNVVDGANLGLGAATTASTTGSTGKFQVGANNQANEQITVSIAKQDSSTLGLASLDLTNTANAGTAITAIDAAISTVSDTRANLGAYQNRFEHTVNNLNVSVENLSASESRIRDTDMAQEMVSFTRAQILTQAGTAMLAQANQAPQSVLKLLQ